MNILRLIGIRYFIDRNNHVESIDSPPNNQSSLIFDGAVMKQRENTVAISFLEEMLADMALAY